MFNVCNINKIKFKKQLPQNPKVENKTLLGRGNEEGGYELHYRDAAGQEGNCYCTYSTVDNHKDRPISGGTFTTQCAIHG